MRDSRHTQRPWNLPPWLEGVHVYSAILGAASAVLALGLFSTLMYAVVAPPAHVEPDDAQVERVVPGPEPDSTTAVAAVPRPGVPRRGRRGRVDRDDRHITSTVGPPPAEILDNLRLPSDPPPAPAPDSVVARRTAPAAAPRPRPRPRREAAPTQSTAAPAAPGPSSDAPGPSSDAPGPSSDAASPEPSPFVSPAHDATPLPEAGTISDEPVTTVIVGAPGDEATAPEAEPASETESSVDGPAVTAAPTFESSPDGVVYVRLSSSPVGAEIRLDGRFRGRTPAKLTLDPGAYDLVLTLDGAKAKLRVDADDDVRLCFAQHGTSLSQVSCSQLR